MKKPCNKCEKSFVYNEKHFPSYINNPQCHSCEKLNKYLKYLESKRKYKRSNEKINSLDELLKQEFVYYGMLEKPWHIEFVKNWQFNTVYNGVNEGMFYKALKNEN